MNRSGFTQTANGLEIDKAESAQLIYTFDWSDWLNEGDTIISAVYEVKARRNDPAPVVINSQGVGPDNLSTYVELSQGQSGKTYTVSALITTDNGLIDSRNFSLNVVDRSA